jgi:hypothetical protein
VPITIIARWLYWGTNCSLCQPHRPRCSGRRLRPPIPSWPSTSRPVRRSPERRTSLPDWRCGRRNAKSLSSAFADDGASGPVRRRHHHRGLLSDLSWSAAAYAAVAIFIVRPVSAWISFVGTTCRPIECATIRSGASAPCTTSRVRWPGRRCGAPPGRYRRRFDPVPWRFR